MPRKRVTFISPSPNNQRALPLRFDKIPAMRNRSRCWVVFATAILLLARPGLSRDVEEKFDDGTVHLRYRTDAQDRKNGDYQEFFPGGKPHVRGTYTADKKSGTWTTFGDNGNPLEIAHYNNDQLDGPYQWNFPSGQPEMRGGYIHGSLAGAVTTFDEKGKLLFSLSYPIPWDNVLKAWNTWSPTDRPETKMAETPVATAPYKAGKIAPECQQSALKYLMLYRFLSGVPAEGMSIDADYVDRAQHGAVIICHLGHLNHKPDKPDDMDEDFYKTAFAGTSQSNLAVGPRNLFSAIDMYMDDSDDSNIARVGHRQWMLNPGMQKTGFGYCDKFSSLYAFDGSNHNNRNWLYIAYPGPGYYPHPMLNDHAAWSLSLNTLKCKVGNAGTIDIAVSALDEHFAVTDTSTATIVAMPMSPNGGAWPCIVFKPEIKHPGVGKYVVSVTGIRTTTGAPAPLNYLVDVKQMPR